MNPLSLHATNYRSFDSLELDLPAGCLAVVGENGAGKSSIVNVIDLALFGPESRSLADYLTDAGEATELELELTFEHAGDFYRLRRGFSAKGRGKTTLDFEREELGNPGDGESRVLSMQWTPLTRESQKETQLAIEEVLGLSRETFRASAFLAQGDAAAFTEAAPARRKAILADVLGLDVWERLLEACRQDKRAAEREASELAGRISLLAEQGSDVEGHDMVRESAKHIVLDSELFYAAAEATFHDAAEQVPALERAEAEYRQRASNLLASEARLAERQAIVDRAAAAKLEAVGVQRQLAEAGDPGAKLAALEDDRAEMDTARERRREQESIRDRYLADAEDARRQAERLSEERRQVETDLARLDQQIDAISDPVTIPHCPTCEQELRGEAHATALSRIREARDDALARIAAYDGRIQVQSEHALSRTQAAHAVVLPAGVSAENYADVQAQIADVRAAELEQAGRREKLRGLEATIAEVTPELDAAIARLAEELADAQAALAEIAQPEPGALDVAKQAALAAKARVDETAGALAEARATLIRSQAALEQAKVFARELDEARGRERELLGELDLLALAERAYGRDGIPALIVEASAIAQIETEANRILAELGTSYRVELRTQRALKSGDGLADTLDVVVIADAGARDYSTFSGGERSRLNVALRIALARLLAHRKGAESRVLILDEVEYLDQAGQIALAGVLQELAVSEFDKIVLVSHADALRDVFDNVITVENEDGRSRIAA